jgi:preprotein translocase subunit SecF
MHCIVHVHSINIKGKEEVGGDVYNGWWNWSLLLVVLLVVLVLILLILLLCCYHAIVAIVAITDDAIATVPRYAIRHRRDLHLECKHLLNK